MHASKKEKKKKLIIISSKPVTAEPFYFMYTYHEYMLVQGVATWVSYTDKYWLHLQLLI